MKRGGDSATEGWSTAALEPGLISVIVPSFNRRRLLVPLLRSIAAQSWPLIELIVVDDGSTDGAGRLLRRTQRLAHCRRVTIVRQANRGPAAARNAGLREARGEFIYFIDSDDLLLAHGLAAMAEPLRGGVAPYALGLVRTFRDGETCAWLDHGGVPRQNPAQPLLNRWMVHAALYRHSAIAAIGSVSVSN